MLEPVRRHPVVAFAVAYVVLAAAVTWPLLPRVASAAGGDGKDAIHALWTSWWWHDSLARGASPFSEQAGQLTGAPGQWLHALNVPFAILTSPFWRLSSGTPLPEPFLYNAMLLATLAAGGLGVLLLCRELWGGDWSAFLSGAVYAVGAYRVGLGIGHIDLVALASSPIYLLGVVQTVRRRGVRAPILAGVALAVSANSSRAHIVFCAMGTLLLLGMMLRADRSEILSPALVRRVLLAGVVFAAAGGWYALGPALQPPPFGRPGDSMGATSVRLEAFLLRTPETAWDGHPHSAEDGPVSTGATPYLGYVVLALAAIALIRVKASRPWLFLAGVGALLALGPRLQVAGRTIDGLSLPFAWFCGSSSPVCFATPTEFTWLLVLGLSVAIGGVLAALVRAVPRGQLVAAVAVTAALVEIWPGVSVAETLPAPRFLRDLSRDRERWAVVDMTSPTRQQWNQMLHHHAVLDEPFTSRIPRQGDAVARSSAIHMLEQMDVRFLITRRSDTSLAWLELPTAFEGNGMVVVEVPPRAGRSVRLGSAQPRRPFAASRPWRPADPSTSMARRSVSR